jgi:hypothetical protein
MAQQYGGVTWPLCQQWCHAFPRWHNSKSIVAFSVGGSRGKWVLGGRQPWKVRSLRRSDGVIWSDSFQLSQFRVNSWVVSCEQSSWEDFKREDFMCVLVQWYWERMIKWDCYNTLWRKELVARVQQWIEDLMCNIWSVWFNETVIVCVLGSAAGRRWVETEAPIPCATVNSEACKQTIALFCLY